MSIDWHAVKHVIYPIKDYEELCQRLQESFAYSFVRNTFNFSLPQLAHYTERMLGGDSRQRYTAYAALLLRALTELQQAAIGDVHDLITRVERRAHLAAFVDQSGLCAPDVAAVLKYLVYWVIPMKKPLSGLVPKATDTSAILKALREAGIRTNLDLLEQGLTAAKRQTLAASSGLPTPLIRELINRADFSRLPWASKATISNIMGAGYGSLAQLAKANPAQLYVDFFGYGQAIGKNLKLGNEIESSYRIAQIVPPVLQDD